jgi:predicted acylesterase/phospholipase RssA
MAAANVESKDLLLSSGFLAFARHAGVLMAFEERGVVPAALCGTSSGALVAALWAAGLRGDRLTSLLASRPPWRLLRPSAAPWRGLLSMAGLGEFLRPHLPEQFEDLPIPLAVGVVQRKHHRLLTSGPLLPAVLASCAMPYVFHPVQFQGRWYQDGGAADRLGLQAWRQWRPGRQAWAHQVARTAGVDVPSDLSGITMISTPRSGANFFSLGDFAGQVGEAKAIALQALK